MVALEGKGTENKQNGRAFRQQTVLESSAASAVVVRVYVDPPQCFVLKRHLQHQIESRSVLVECVPITQAGAAHRKTYLITTTLSGKSEGTTASATPELLCQPLTSINHTRISLT